MAGKKLTFESIEPNAGLERAATLKRPDIIAGVFLDDPSVYLGAELSR